MISRIVFFLFFFLSGFSFLWSGMSLEAFLLDKNGKEEKIRILWQDQSLRVSSDSFDLLIRDGKSYVLDSVSGYAMDSDLLGKPLSEGLNLSQWLSREFLIPTDLKMFIAGYSTQAYYYRNDKGQEAYLFFSKDAVLKAMMMNLQPFWERSPASVLALCGALSDCGVLLGIKTGGHFLMKVNRIRFATYSESFFRLPSVLNMDQIIQSLKELE